MRTFDISVILQKNNHDFGTQIQIIGKLYRYGKAMMY